MTSEILTAKVKSINSLTPTIFKYYLTPARYVNYFAGQYLQIIIADNAYSYSIANPPLNKDHYELHIRHSSNNQVKMSLLENSEVQIKLPFGDCYLGNMHKTMPIIFIAVGLGFAPIKAMLEQLFANCDNREKQLYWGVRVKRDLYMHDMVQDWQISDKNFIYNSYIDQESEDSLIAQVIRDNKGNLSKYQIVMCGPFELIYKMRDLLLENGVKKKNMYSDAFSFEN